MQNSGSLLEKLVRQRTTSNMTNPSSCFTTESIPKKTERSTNAFEFEASKALNACQMIPLLCTVTTRICCSFYPRPGYSTTSVGASHKCRIIALDVERVLAVGSCEYSTTLSGLRYVPPQSLFSVISLVGLDCPLEICTVPNCTTSGKREALDGRFSGALGLSSCSRNKQKIIIPWRGPTLPIIHDFHAPHRRKSTWERFIMTCRNYHRNSSKCIVHTTAISGVTIYIIDSTAA
jgi:hypothetical protein